jgi:hypothetical protein
MMDNREFSEKFEEPGSSFGNKEALLADGSQFGHLRTLQLFVNISSALSSGIFCGPISF